MAGLGDLPELVRDSRLQTAVRDTETIHVRPSARRNVSRHERWVMKDLIGHGGGGVVWLQRRVEGSGPVELRAVKGIKTGARVDTASINRRFVRELEASAKFSQEKYAEYFVKSYGWYDTPGWLHITMEYCPHGDLGTFLGSKALPEDQVQDIAVQVLQGLTLMHGEGFAHRDLKPSNILIMAQPPEDGWWVKLCDLGLSRRNGDASGSTTVRGTPEFMAPETIGPPFEGDPTTADPMKADMWCLGETIARALTGRITFGMQSLLQYQKGYIEFPEVSLRAANISQDAIHFIHSLMMARPADRPDAARASRDAWISSKADQSLDYGKSLGSVSDFVSLSDDSLLPGTTTIRSTTQSTQASGKWTATMPLREFQTANQPTQVSEQWTATMTVPSRVGQDFINSSDHWRPGPQSPDQRTYTPGTQANEVQSSFKYDHSTDKYASAPREATSSLVDTRVEYRPRVPDKPATYRRPIDIPDYILSRPARGLAETLGADEPEPERLYHLQVHCQRSSLDSQRARAPDKKYPNIRRRAY
ncbi:kinase-like domain-containing protein [Lophiotrema nucula]|uniref:mitogen-activated protein kinase kinase n=1 Tax=Lophiotrema nucula TaxID=690887 RepID=A0A6A5ZG07_9PLEO|nr:kinase-like domain-containing protein [Lophiotrema nucula]